MSRIQLTRRALIKYLGAAAAAAGVPAAVPLLSSPAEADDTNPKRLLLYYTNHSSFYASWRMPMPGASDEADYAYDLGPLAEDEFSPVYQPLYRHRSKLAILDSLSNMANLSHGSEARGHAGGPSTVFTSSRYLDGDANYASAPSIDQLVADAVAVPGRIRSLEYGHAASIWSGPGALLPTEHSPIGAYNRIFDFLPDPDMTAEPTREERIARARGSVLDFVADRYGEVAPRLSGADRLRIEAHQQLIRDLELQLDGLGSITCERPERPTDDGQFADNLPHFARIIGTAFSCDVTRVASIQTGELRATDFGAPSSDIHGEYAHHDNVVERQDWMVEYYRKHASDLAMILDVLDGIPEADGSTVLDNTIVLWAQECGSWIHQTSHLALVVAGGGGLNMGRYVHWGRQPIPAIDRVHGGNNVGTNYRADQVGPAHSRLLVSIAQQFGLEVDRVGTLDSVEYGGGTFPLTGALDRMV